MGPLVSLWGRCVRYEAVALGCPQFSVDVQKVLALLEVLGCIELRVFSAGRMEKVGAAPRPYRGPMAPLDPRVPIPPMVPLSLYGPPTRLWSP